MRLLEGLVAQYDEDAEAHIARTSGSTQTSRAALNDLIVGLKADGTWSEIEVLNILQPTKADSLLDVKNYSDATEIGSLTFTTTDGFEGWSTSNYIDSEFSPSAATLFAENDNGMFMYHSKMPAQAMKESGASELSVVDVVALGYRRVSGTLFRTRFYSQSVSYVDIDDLTDTPKSFIAGSRPDALTQVTVAGTDTTTDSISSGGNRCADDCFIGAFNNNGAAPGDSLSSTAGVTAWGFTSGLSAASLVSIGARLDTYMDAIGANRL